MEERNNQDPIPQFESNKAARTALKEAELSTREALGNGPPPEQRTFLEGLLENLQGAMAWLEAQQLRRKGTLVAVEISLALGMLTSCAPAVFAPVIPIAGGDTSTPTTEFSPTLSPVTETPTPTVVIPTPTIVTTPTEAPTPINEHDLNPAYTEKVSQKYLGVQINAELTTDESMDSVIKKITVPEGVYAEFVARSIFKDWWSKGSEPHTGIPSEDDFKSFMALWSKAQETNNPADWQKVQLENIWANDLNDGNGYVQNPYTIWPMFDGVAPEGVRGINNMEITIVNRNGTKNIALLGGNNPYNTVYGTNLNGDSLIVCMGVDSFSISPNLPYLSSNMIASTNSWLIRNNGGSVADWPSIDNLSKLLYNGGLTVQK